MKYAFYTIVDGQGCLQPPSERCLFTTREEACDFLNSDGGPYEPSDGWHVEKVVFGRRLMRDASGELVEGSPL